MDRTPANSLREFYVIDEGYMQTLRKKITSVWFWSVNNISGGLKFLGKLRNAQKQKLRELSPSEFCHTCKIGRYQFLNQS